MPRGREGLGSFGQSNPKHHDKTVQIPTVRIGLLFGKGGATLRDIKEQSGCVDIWIDQERANGLGLEHCDVVLRGEPKATSRAKRLIEEKVQSSTTTTIQIPTERIGAIVGKGGSTLKQLKERSGCSIWIESDKAHSEGSEWCDVLLTGAPEAMSLAQQLIEETLGSGQMVHQIPAECIGSVLGHEHATLNELKAKSGCSIWVEYDRANREGSRLCDVVLRGDPATFAVAQQLINEKVGEFYQHSDSASDAGTSVSSMSMESTGLFQDKSGEPPSQSDFPALPGATAVRPIKRTSHAAKKATAGGLWPIAELVRTASAERLRRLESQRLEEKQKKLAVR